MNELVPNSKKDGIFAKIKKWFVNIFKSNNEILKPVAVAQENVNLIDDQTSDFKETIKIENREKLLNTQQQLREGIIQMSELSNKELDELIELYNEQIAEKKMQIQQYLSKLKKK